MTNPHPSPSPASAADSTPVGWWDRAAIIALGGAGCALSYDALQQMAVAIHVRPQLSYLFPLVIDGFIAYGIRALLVMSTAPLRARLYTWTLFATATTASIWANALHAVRLNQQTHQPGLRLGDHVVAVLSTIAPLALAGAVHLYILITRHHPARDMKKDRPRPDRPRTLVPVRADTDGTIRTGPLDPIRADRTHDQAHCLNDQRTADRRPDRRTSGPDQDGGPQRGPADHTEAGPPEQSSGPRGDRADQDAADHEPPDHWSGDHRGQGDHGPATAGAGHSLQPGDHDAVPADRPGDHTEVPGAEPQAATEPAADAEPAAPASALAETSAGQLPSNELDDDLGGDATALELVSAEPSVEAGDRREVRADHRGDAERDRGPADHAGTTSGDRPPARTGGPGHPADHDHRGDRPGGPADHDRDPAEGTGIPDHRADHGPGDPHTVGGRGSANGGRTGPETEDVGDRPHPRTTDRTGTRPAGAAPDAGEAAGLEELLSIARQAALSEGRMTRRALRPHLNEAGVPISNRRFTELQRRLYADPALAHLPRPGKRP